MRGTDRQRVRPGFGRRPRCRAGGSLWRRGISLRRSRRLRPGVLRGPCAFSAFLRATQPEAAEALDLSNDSPARRKFLARLQGEISKRGAIDVLRHGIKHGPHPIDLFYGTPSPGNPAAAGYVRLSRADRETGIRPPVGSAPETFGRFVPD